MRYLHKAATIIHSRILFTEHMTSKHLIKHVVWTRILYKYNHYSGTSCKLSCDYRVWVHVISTWTVFLGFTGTMWTFPWSLEFRWDVLGENAACLQFAAAACYSYRLAQVQWYLCVNKPVCAQYCVGKGCGVTMQKYGPHQNSFLLLYILQTQWVTPQIVNVGMAAEECATTKARLLLSWTMKSMLDRRSHQTQIFPPG